MSILLKNNLFRKILSYIKIFLDFLCKSNFFIYCFYVLSIIFPIFFVKGGIFLVDYPYTCIDNKVFDFLQFDNFSIINFLYRFFSSIIGCDLFSRLFIFISLYVFVYSCYKLSFLFSNNKKISLVVSFFGLISPFTYSKIENGQIELILACGFFFLACYFIFDLLIDSQNKTKKFKKNVVSFFIFVSLAILLIPHFLLISLFLIPVVFIVCYKYSLKIKNIFLYFLLFMLIFVSINYRLFFGVYGNLSKNYLNLININRELVLQSYFVPIGNNLYETVFNSLNLSNQFTENIGYNFKSLVYEYPKPLIIVSFFGFFTLFICGVFLSIKKNYLNLKFIYFYLIGVFIVCLVLSFGLSKNIFYKLNSFIFFNIPFFDAMRDSSKWNIFIIIIYLIFVSIFFTVLNQFLYKRGKMVLFNSLIILFFINSIIRAPYLFFGMCGQMMDVIKPLPNDFYVVRKYLLNESIRHDSKILVLPWSEYVKPKFLVDKSDRIVTMFNYFTRFFPYYTFGFNNVNRYADYPINDKMFVLNNMDLGTVFIDYIKLLKFKYIVYVGSYYLDVNTYKYYDDKNDIDFLTNNLNLEKVFSSDYIYLFKIK